jgi:endonuclease G, mitochondrial
MDRLERAKRLQAMLKQIAPKNDIESVPRPPAPARFTEGLESAAADPVRTGLQKLAENRVEAVTEQEQNAMEAIVMVHNRPVVFVRGQSYDDITDTPWLSLNRPEVKSRLSSLFPGIGRIELPQNPLIPYGGTGFVVGKGRLMTNRHVAQIFSGGLGMQIRYQTGGSAVDFKRQVDTPDSDRSAYMTVTGVEMIHPYWDMAILKVDGLPDSRMLRLSTKSPEDLVDHNIIVVGYPARDERNDLAIQDRIFEGKYYVKRLQPGTVRARAKVQSFENTVNALTHDASTLGGNSGSAIIDIDAGEVVALHFGGVYLKANYAVPMYELARDRRVAPVLNFDGAVASTNDWEASWVSTEAGSEALKVMPQRNPPKGVPAAPLQSPQPSTGIVMSNQSATFTIPLQITVSIGVPAMAPPPQPIPGGAAAAAVTAAAAGEVEAVVVDQDYSGRPGYDPEFLESIAVPLPKITKAMEKDTARVQADAQKHDDPFELAYYHYSVYMNKARRTAWFSAANVDGEKRPNIGSRQGDRWYRDTRILKAEQLGQEAFEPGIDRGHLTRREDTAWGDDVDSATAANNDTFHFTNCSLQASAFNRGKDRWQGLEQFLLEQHAKKDKRRMTVITGPLFGPTDPVYKNDRMDYTVRCPLQFWKVCVLIRENGTPSATAFILGQEEIKDLPGFEEAFDVAATQIKVSDLEERTGLDFGELKDHDHFAEGGAPGTLEAVAGTTGATRRGRVIRHSGDIVV